MFLGQDILKVRMPRLKEVVTIGKRIGILSTKKT